MIAARVAPVLLEAACLAGALAGNASRRAVAANSPAWFAVKRPFPVDRWGLQ